MEVEDGQYKMEELSAFMEICCHRIADIFNNKKVEEWTNGDFIRLSSLLSNKTNVQISPNTLKRIFRKIKTSSWYYPQKATRDALARYIGYTDWENFIHHQHIVQAPVVAPPIPPIEEKLLMLATPAPKRHSRKWLLTATVVSLLVVIAFIIRWSGNQPGNEGSDGFIPIQIVCTNPVGENPHSAIFKLVKPVGFADSAADYRLEFGDGKTEQLNVRDTLIAHYYEIPGRYLAFLWRDGLAIDTLPIYLRTSGWTATATVLHDTTRVYPVDAHTSNGRLSVNALEVYRAGVDTNRTFFVQFVNAKPVEISGDNFELSARITTSPPRPGVRCSQVSIQVFGERSFHRIYSMKPGCAAWLNLRLSDNVKGGKNSDLRFLGHDFSGGGIISLRVVNQAVEILFDGEVVHRDTYKFPLAKIYGVNITFAGTGTVSDFMLKDLRTGVVYE